MIRREPDARAAADCTPSRRPSRARSCCPATPGYEDARRPAVARFDGVRPHAVVRCRTAEDVAAGARVARRRGCSSRVRSGGHCFAGRSSSDGRRASMSRRMDAASRSTAGSRRSAPARGSATSTTRSRPRLTIPAGCGPDVGIAGLTLGGGLGVLGRLHGADVRQPRRRAGGARRRAHRRLRRAARARSVLGAARRRRRPASASSRRSRSAPPGAAPRRPSTSCGPRTRGRA